MKRTDAGTKVVDLGGKTLMPGFVDPHLHPVQGAAMTMPTYITPFDWKFPWGDANAVRGHDAFIAKVKVQEKALADPKEPLIIWGFLEPYHGKLNRAMLDAITTDRPIIVWSYSAHEMYFNTPALRTYGFTAGEVEGNMQVDYDNGIYREAGFMEFAVPKIRHLLMDEAKLTIGLKRLKDLVHQGGVTTVGDMGIGSSGDLKADFATLRSALDNDDSPFRMRLVPDTKTLDLVLSSDEALLLSTVQSLPDHNSNRLLFGRIAKVYADGAFFAEAMQLDPPGYKDGHEGQWMMSPERMKQLMELWWTNGFDIHIHCNGSMALSTILDKMEELKAKRPNGDQRVVIEHFGVSSAEQAARIAKLGLAVSANPYYFYTMADMYAEGNLGPQRASEIVRLGSLRKNNVPFALHSDFTMCPIEPLLLAWIAVNRVTANGSEMAPQEKVSVYDALRAVTANAAYVLRLEDEVGSLVAGKKADFVILAENPMKVDPIKIKDIRVVETVFEGRSFPVA
jgi:predicted amidohydrolase YtcJ